MKFNLFDLRTWPTPEYGNYLGAKRRCISHAINAVENSCLLPVDSVDRVAQQHDKELGKDDFADLKFAGRMLLINPFTTKYKRPVYGRMIQYGSAIVIGTIGLLFTPFRMLKKFL